MHAIVVTALGGPEAIEARDLPEPHPEAGEVAIRVTHAGVNYAEVMLRRGDYPGPGLPFGPGLEVAGHVTVVGDGVDGLRVGEPVAAFTVDGGYAETAVARATMTHPLARYGGRVDLATAAAFPTIVPSAYAMLVELACLRAGESVLIHAAAGGVGTVAGQLARHLGAGLVLGTAGSPAKAAYAQPFGFDRVLPHDGFADAVREATGGRGVDVVLDSIGGPVHGESLAVLAPMGRLITFGNASRGEAVPHPSLGLQAANKAVMGWNSIGLSFRDPARLAAISRRALDLLAAGTVRIDVTEKIPLARAADAHRRLEGRETTGKLVLTVAA